MVNVRFAACAVLLLSLAACTSEPLEFADWTIPVPEGTPVIEYAAVPTEERTERLELVEDLVIGERGDDPNYAFYRPDTVKADSRGRIYVLDGGNNRLQVFGPDGEYLRTLGGEGEGPGEFASSGGWSQFGMIVAGGQVIVLDGMQSRTSTWNTEGIHLGDVSTLPTRFVDLLAGLPDGSSIGETRLREEGEDGERLSFAVVGLFSLSWEPLHDIIKLPSPPNLQVGGRGLMRPTGSPRFAAAGEGILYATAGDEYQVLAFNADGGARWALRVAHERRPFTAEHRDTITDMVKHNQPDLDTTGTEWPTRIGSISNLLVDGYGHLYVTEFVVPYMTVPDEVAVDIYSPEGDRLFAGYMPNVRWRDAVGDFIYAIRSDSPTGEEEVVRYRLVGPF